MAWAAYEVEVTETYEGEYRVETLLRVDATKSEAIDRIGSRFGVVRQVLGVPVTPFCQCGSPYHVEDDKWYRCYDCRASDRISDFGAGGARS